MSFNQTNQFFKVNFPLFFLFFFFLNFSLIILSLTNSSKIYIGITDAINVLTVLTVVVVNFCCTLVIDSVCFVKLVFRVVANVQFKFGTFLGLMLNFVVR